MYVHWEDDEDEMSKEQAMLLKVLYKIPSERKQTQLDYCVGSLKEMMKLLEREGVTEQNVEYMYIHYSPRGTTDVIELVAVDNRVPKQREANTESNVLPFLPTKDRAKAAETAAKPRVRLKAQAVPTTPCVRGSIYAAYQV
jgi:hypothetical protein